jgi:hypothetical protein
VRVVLIDAATSALAVDRAAGLIFVSTGCDHGDAERLGAEVLSPAEMCLVRSAGRQNCLKNVG